jgi:hypothetical protein
METQEKQLWQSLPRLEPPAGLLGRILSAIDAKRLRQVWMRFFLSAIGCLASLGYAAWNAASLWSQWQESSWFDMVRLWVTDSDVMFANAQEAFLGVLEVIPWDAILISLAIVVCAIYAFGLVRLLYREGRLPLFHRIA